MRRFIYLFFKIIRENENLINQIWKSDEANLCLPSSPPLIGSHDLISSPSRVMIITDKFLITFSINLVEWTWHLLDMQPTCDAHHLLLIVRCWRVESISVLPITSCLSRKWLCHVSKLQLYSCRHCFLLPPLINSHRRRPFNGAETCN